MLILILFYCEANSILIRNVISLKGEGRWSVFRNASAIDYEGFEITHLFLSQSFRCLSLCLHLCSAVAVPYPLLLSFILASLEAPSTSFKPLSSHLGPEKYNEDILKLIKSYQSYFLNR